MPLRVALDATLWDEPTTGIGLVTRALHAALVREGAQVLRVGARSSGEFPRGRRSRTGYLLEGLPALLRRERFDVFHALSNFNLPLQRVEGTRLVLTVHDLIPLREPQTVSAAFRWQFRLWLARSLVVADRVLAVSAHTRAQLRARFPGAEATVVPNGVDHVDGVPAPDRISRQWLDAQHLPSDFILYAGALEARKNVGLVLEACLKLKARGAPTTLVLLGQRGFGSDALAARLAAARAQGLDVRALGHQPDAIFYEVMRRAGVLAFPSRDEGFGLPPLEAMRLGVPVVISDAGALGEVCGPSAPQVGVDDAEGLAQALQAQRTPSPERTRRIAEGRAWTDRFTWAAAARATLALYGG